MLHALRSGVPTAHVATGGAVAPPPAMPKSLGFHADPRCRHSGARPCRYAATAPSMPSTWGLAYASARTSKVAVFGLCMCVLQTLEDSGDKVIRVFWRTREILSSQSLTVLLLPRPTPSSKVYPPYTLYPRGRSTAGRAVMATKRSLFDKRDEGSRHRRALGV